MAGANGSTLTISYKGTTLPALPLGPISFSKQGVWEDTTPYGVQDQQQTYAGLRKLGDIKLELLYDDTPTTGEDAVFDNVGDSGAAVLTWKSGKTTTFTAGIKGYDRNAGVGKVTRAVVTIACSGPVTEA